MALAFAVRDWMSPREAILDEVGIAPGFRVLDYGCGPGSYIVAAARRAGASGRVYAVDSNPLALEEARRRAAANGLSNVATIRTDCATGLPNESIDRALLYDILHGLDRPADVLAELQRVLKRDGVLSVSDHHLSEAEILDRVTRAGSFKLSSKGAKTYSFTKVGE